MIDWWGFGVYDVKETCYKNLESLLLFANAGGLLLLTQTSSRNTSAFL
jgi:hypothetical protein